MGTGERWQLGSGEKPWGEVTVGWNHRRSGNLVVRPELRFDMHQFARPGTQAPQNLDGLYFSIDAILSF